MAETAGGVHAEVVAGDDDPFPGPEGTVRAGSHLPHGVDAGCVRVLPGDPGSSQGGEGVLVVERRIVDL